MKNTKKPHDFSRNKMSCIELISIWFLVIEKFNIKPFTPTCLVLGVEIDNTLKHITLTSLML